MNNETPKVFTNCWFEYISEESFLFEEILLYKPEESGDLIFPKPRFVKDNIVFV